MLTSNCHLLRGLGGHGRFRLMFTLLTDTKCILTDKLINVNKKNILFQNKDSSSPFHGK